MIDQPAYVSLPFRQDVSQPAVRPRRTGSRFPGAHTQSRSVLFVLQMFSVSVPSLPSWFGEGVLTDDGERAGACCPAACWALRDDRCFRHASRVPCHAGRRRSCGRSLGEEAAPATIRLGLRPSRDRSELAHRGCGEAHRYGVTRSCEARPHPRVSDGGRLVAHRGEVAPGTGGALADVVRACLRRETHNVLGFPNAHTITDQVGTDKQSDPRSARIHAPCQRASRG